MDDFGEPPGDDEAPLGWEWRVFAVALFWALPGAVAGALAGLFLSAVDLVPLWIPIAAGGVFGSIGGGLLESDHLG
jgi:hypothetical protein